LSSHDSKPTQGDELGFKRILLGGEGDVCFGILEEKRRVRLQIILNIRTSTRGALPK
jgi:hypothetical protein